MEQLMTVANDVKATRDQPLGEVGRIQKRSKDCKEELTSMYELGLKLTILRTAEQEAVHDWDTVVAVQPGEGTEAQHFS